MPPTSPTPAPPLHAGDGRVDAARTLGARAWISAALLLAALVALDRFVLRTHVLTSYRSLPAQSPLYAFWMPMLAPAALVFVALGTALVAFAPPLCEPARVQRVLFLCALASAAALLPPALFAVREPPAHLGANLDTYRDEEFVHDARKIPLMRDAEGRTGVSAFLEHYVEVMPRLSLHGQHFPPGHALWAHAVERVFGPSPLAQALAVLAAFVAAALAVFGALRTLLDERAARQAALACVCAPSLLDFACTSMDAVFLLWAALAWLAGMRALRPVQGEGGVAAGWPAVAAGALLALAACASFAALFVGFALALYALESARRARASWSATLRALLCIGAAFAASLLIVWLTTGFAWWSCLLHARESGLALMTRILHGPPSARWLELSVGNAGAFLLGSGVALVAALLGGRGAAATPAAGVWRTVVLVELALLCFGGVFFMETERIWIFAIPWLVAAAAASGAWSAGTLRCVIAVALAQALAMEALLFTLW